MPLYRVCSTGMGILLSWFTVVVPTNTSPMAAPWALKPPAVPTLTSRSGLYCWQAKYVVNAAGTVPTLSTLCSASLPAHTHTHTLQSTATPASWDQVPADQSSSLVCFCLSSYSKKQRGHRVMWKSNPLDVLWCALCWPASLPVQHAK